MRRPLLWVALALSVGCAHRTVVAADLDRVKRPAFVSRIEEGGGPRARVFREDSTWGERLQRIEAREADRRLQLKLAKATTRFQVSDGLRSAVLARLPREAPWTTVVPPANVASVLESFLVEEVPANAPDYELLRQLGADSVVEFVVEEFGMRSESGRAQVFLSGYGRLFFLGGPVVWFRPFRRDNVELGVAGIDPFEVGKNPDLYRDAFAGLLGSVADELAEDLKPKERRAPPPAAAEPKAAPPEKEAPAEAAPSSPPAKDETPRQRLPEDEL